MMIIMGHTEFCNALAGMTDGECTCGGVHTIEFSGDEQTKTCVVSGDEEAFIALIEMLQTKIKLKGNKHQAVYFKDRRGNDFKLRFDLLDA